MLFDTHAHIDASAFAEDRAEVLARAQEAGVSLLLNIGYSEEVIPTTLALAEQHDWIYAAVGIHPHEAAKVTEATWGRLAEWLAHPRVRALGEVGLDYHYDFATPEQQAEVFRRQIRLAKELGLPLVIHNREASDDVVRLLQEEGAGEVGGIMHCFSGDLAMAEACLKMNFYISFAGPVTFKKSDELRQVAAQVPLDRILIETDSPYLAPVPRRGKRNEPAYVRYTAEQLAELRGLSLAELARITAENGRRLLRI